MRWKPTPRQRLALENPRDSEVNDPKLRVLRMVGPPTHVDPDGTQRAVWQLSSHFAVDLDDPPVWHLGLAIRRGGTDDPPIPTSRWEEWMANEALAELAMLIPDARTRPTRTYRNVEPRSVHFRSVLTDAEKAWLPGVGIAV